MTMNENDFHVYVGGRSGVFKGAKLSLTSCVTKHLQSLEAITQDDQVTALGWGNDEETEVLIACGVKGNKSVKVYDTESASFSSSFYCDIGKGSINGISRYNESVLTAVESGEVKLWRFREEEEVLINAGPDLKRMRHSQIHKNIIATGGKEHSLQMFDIETQKRVFLEKNLPNDTLQLKMPVWISDIQFLPGRELIATCGRYGHIRLYDPKTQRRPIIKLEMKGEALTTLSTTPRDVQVLVGSGTGRMNLVDLRKPGKILNTYKGFTGSVTGIMCPRSPYIISVSLDRFLRIHDLDSKQQLKKVYLASNLTSLLVKSDFSLGVDEANGNDNRKRGHASKNGIHSSKDGESDEEYDSMFDKMQTIGSKSKPKTEDVEDPVKTTDVSAAKIRSKNKKLGRSTKKLKTNNADDLSS